MRRNGRQLRCPGYLPRLLPGAAGDVNGDGFDEFIVASCWADVIVGSMYYDSGAPDAGGAFVYLPEPDLAPALLLGLTLLASPRPLAKLR